MKIIVYTKKELDELIDSLENDDSVETYEIEFTPAKARDLGALWKMDNPRPSLATVTY